MSELTKTLAERLGTLRATADEWSGRGLTEQDTKNALIEPILAALGWPKDDLTRVRAEFRHTAKANPVDYALLDGGRPVVFVEAKALDKQLDDYKFIAQVIAYAATAGVEWAVVTNGQRWDLYAALARAQDARKRVFSVDIHDDEAAEWLAWISPGRVQDAQLSHFWKALTSEKAVREALMSLFTSRDDDFVALLAKRSGVRESDVSGALNLMTIKLDTPSVHAFGTQVASPPNPPITVAPKPPGPETSKPSPRPKHVPGAATAPRLSAPEPGTKPQRLRIGSTVHPVKSWVDVLRVALLAVHASDPKAFAGLMVDPDFDGKKRRMIASSPVGLRKPIQIGPAFVESNLSAGSIVDLVNRVLDKTGPLEIELE